VKWIVFLVAICVVTPLLARYAARSEVVRRWLVGLMAFSVFHTVDINLITELYRGDSTGIEVTLLDLMALALYAAQRRRRVPTPDGPRFTWVRFLYLGVAILSMTASPSLMLSWFSVWKIVRMYFVFSVLFVEFAELAQVRAALMGLAAGVISQGVMAVEQRYLGGLVRAVGSQPHPNSLAMLVNLVIPVSLALLLSGHWKRLNAAVLLTGSVCVVLSLSRGGILMLAVAVAIVVLGSLAKDFQLKKLAVVGSLMVGGLLLLAKSIGTILERFTNAPKASEEARVLFNQAAKAMADEHPLGVGINMFSKVLEAGGYADRFDLAPVDRNGVAHHIYWLTAAELGYIGLTFYIVMLVVILMTAARAAAARGVRGDIALGIAAGFVVTYIQGTAEWIARQTPMSYAFWTLTAILASQGVRAWPKKAKQGAPRGVQPQVKGEVRVAQQA
jgi:hypothetical protein